MYMLYNTCSYVLYIENTENIIHKFISLLNGLNSLPITGGDPQVSSPWTSQHFRSISTF